MNRVPELESKAWSVADILRGKFKPAEYGKVILPFTVLRRLDQAWASKRAEFAKIRQALPEGLAPEFEQAYLLSQIELPYYHQGKHSLEEINAQEPDHLREALLSWIQEFSPEVREIFLKHFHFPTWLQRLEEKEILAEVLQQFLGIDLSPDSLTNAEMGGLFESLLRRFSEMSGETAGEHYTPRDVVRLMVDLILCEDVEVQAGKPAQRRIYDPTCGTGGLLSIAEERIKAAAKNSQVDIELYGQEINDESYAVCQADMLLKGQTVGRIRLGNTLTTDCHAGETFHLMLSNPPFGVDWKVDHRAVSQEHARGAAGRFAPGLPRQSDGSMLFLLHLLSKMRPVSEGGSRIAIVLSGSSLFSGGAGSGESEIRRHVLENDLVEAIIGLPTDMFFNTGIATYVWILSNVKPAHRKGQVQLIDMTRLGQKMRKSLGSKRKEIRSEDVQAIVALFRAGETADLAILTDAKGAQTHQVLRSGDSTPSAPMGGKVQRVPLAKVFPTTAFGYRQITVERPLRDPQGEPMKATKGKAKGQLIPDPELRDTERVPLEETIDAYMAREVLPHAPDAWVDGEKTRVGYEIFFTRHFYVSEPPPPLAEIDADLLQVSDRIRALLGVKEKRQAVISHAVTKGLDPSAPMKDSGVPWLGQVPAHWNLTRLRFIARFNPSKSEIGSLPPETEVSFLPMDAIGDDGSLRLDATRPLSAVEQGYTYFRDGDLLIAKITPCFENGKGALAAGLLGGIGFGTTELIVVRPLPGRAVAAYLHWLFVGPDFRNAGTAAMYGAGGQKRVPDEFVRDFVVAVPPLAEQRAIAAFLDRECSKIDTLITEAERAIALLKERRSALISAAVTGKIDVRNPPHEP